MNQKVLMWRTEISHFMQEMKCGACEGKRLRSEVLGVLIQKNLLLRLPT